TGRRRYRGGGVSRPGDGRGGSMNERNARTQQFDEHTAERGMDEQGAAAARSGEPVGAAGDVDTSVFDAEVRDAADRVVERYPEPRSALLPLLHLVQSVQGHVSEAGVAFCAEQLGLDTAEVSAVATFYTMYKRRPCGQHLVSVCTNTLCAA